MIHHRSINFLLVLFYNNYYYKYHLLFCFFILFSALLHFSVLDFCFFFSYCFSYLFVSILSIFFFKTCVCVVCSCFLLLFSFSLFLPLQQKCLIHVVLLKNHNLKRKFLCFFWFLFFLNLFILPLLFGFCFDLFFCASLLCFLFHLLLTCHSPCITDFFVVLLFCCCVVSLFALHVLIYMFVCLCVCLFCMYFVFFLNSWYGRLVYTYILPSSRVLITASTFIATAVLFYKRMPQQQIDVVIPDHLANFQRIQMSEQQQMQMQ